VPISRTRRGVVRESRPIVLPRSFRHTRTGFFFPTNAVIHSSDVRWSANTEWRKIELGNYHLVTEETKLHV
jgi:hypothetical protein